MQVGSKEATGFDNQREHTGAANGPKCSSINGSGCKDPTRKKFWPAYMQQNPQAQHLGPQFLRKLHPTASPTYPCAHTRLSEYMRDVARWRRDVNGKKSTSKMQVNKWKSRLCSRQTKAWGSSSWLKLAKFNTTCQSRPYTIKNMRL